jgi:hypothetical protein
VRAPGCEGELPTQALPALKWHSEVEKEEEEEGGQGGTTSISAAAAAMVGREGAVGAGIVEVLLSGDVLEQPVVAAAAAAAAARDTVNHEVTAELEKEENTASNGGSSSSTSGAIKDSSMSILEADSRPHPRSPRRRRRPSQVVYNPPGGLIVQGPAAARAVLRVSGQISVDDLQQVLLSKYSPSAMQLKELFLAGSSMAPSERSKMFGNRNDDADVGAESSAELQSRQELLAAMQSFGAVFSNTATATADATTMLLLEGFRVALLKRLVKPLAHTGVVALGAPLHAESRLGGNSFRYNPGNFFAFI